jgi:hypothetical protein
MKPPSGEGPTGRLLSPLPGQVGTSLRLFRPSPLRLRGLLVVSSPTDDGTDCFLFLVRGTYPWFCELHSG